MYMNFDEVMHIRYPVFPYEPQLLTVLLLEKEGEILFGFAIQIVIHRLDYYEYTQGRGKIP